MAIIYSYPDALVTDLIRLVGSNTAVTGNPTISLSVANLADFILSDFSTGTAGYLPYYDTASSLKASYILQNTTTLLVTVEEDINMAKNLTVAGNATISGLLNGFSGAFSSKLSVATGLTVGTAAVAGVGVGLYAPTTVFDTFTVDTGYLSTFKGDLELDADLIDILGNPGTSTQVLTSKGNGLGVQWVDQVQSGLVFQGTWNALTNSPTLASGVGVAGYYYIVDPAGTTNLDGITDWQIGDWAIFSSTNVWQKVDNTSIIGGAGTANTLPKWTGSTTLGDSLITDDGTTITLDTTTITLEGTAISGSQTNLYSEITDVKGSLVLGSTVSAGGVVGTAGQLLSSTATGVAWADESITSSVPEVSFAVYNDTGSTITKGTACKIVGEITYLSVVYPLVVPGSGSETNCVGVVASDVTTAAVGKVLVTGMLEDIITSPLSGGGIPSAGTQVFQKGSGLTIIRPTTAAGPIQIVGRVFVVSTVATGKIWIDVKNQVEELPNITSTKVIVGDTFNQPVESTILSVDDTNTQVAIGGLSTAVATDFISLITKSSGIKANWLQYGENSDVLSTDIRYTIQNSTTSTGLSYNLVNSDLGDFYISKGDPSIGAAVVEEKIASFTSNDSSTISSTQNLISFYDNNFTSGDDIADNPFASTANSSAAIGINHTVSGNYSMAVGKSNNVGTNGYAFGISNIVTSPNSVAFGFSNNLSSSADYSMAIGYQHTVSAFATFVAGETNDVSGNYAAAIGKNNSVVNSGSYSLCVGLENVVQGAYSLIAGQQNETSSDWGLIAGGANTVGINSDYIAVFGGSHTIVGSQASIVSGQNNSISANSSATFGGGLINSRDSATVLGQYNLAQASGEIFTIGSGTSAAARTTAMSLIGTFGNADYELKVSGNIWGTGGIKDSDGQLGTAGQVLSTTGVLTNWIDAATGGTLNGLTDCLVTANSMFLGQDPTATFNNAVYNVSVGITSLSVITTGDNNTVMGYNAGLSITESSYSTIIGSNAGKLLTTGSYNTLIGEGTGQSLTSGWGNVFIGYNAGSSTGEVIGQVSIGYLSGRLATGSSNTTVGWQTGASITTGQNNTLLGHSAGRVIVTGQGNSVIGTRAGNNMEGSYNTMMGYQAGYQTTSMNNVFIGKEAGKNLTTGGQNVAIGANALEGVDAGSNNIAIGYNALTLQNLGTPGLSANNTAVGYSAGSILTSGTQNVFLGFSTGTLVTSGSNNTLLGYNAEPSSSAAVNQIIIGHGVTGHGDNITVIGNTSNIAIHAAADNTTDLGSPSYSFKDSYVQGTSNAGGFKVDDMQAVPASATAAGTVGDIRFTSDYIFVCIATDTWKRVAIATW